MKIIAGLGNPGEKYKLTRHNVGFWAVDELAKKLNLSWQHSKKFQADFCKHENTILVKPFTFMNDSGKAVKAILSYYNLLPKKLGLLKKDSDLTSTLVIIHDDIDIEIGKYKKSIDSRSAGHRGIESIIIYLKTKKITRFRVGVKNELLNKIPAEKFVLQKFSPEEKKIIENVLSQITQKEII